MPTGIPAADVIGGVIGLGEAVSGLINEGKTKEEARQIANSRPKYQTSPEISQDLSLATSELNNGNTAAQNAYDTVSNQQFSNATDAILKSGGSVNNIGDLYGNSLDGRLKLKMMRDNMRLQQIQTLSRAREAKANEEQTQWQVDKLAPWQDRAQANAAARQAASGQVNTGVNTFGSSAMNAAATLQEENQFRLPKFNNAPGFNGNYATGVPTGNSAPPITGADVLTPNNNFPSYGF